MEDVKQEVKQEFKQGLKQAGSVQDWLSFNKMITPIIIKIIFWFFAVLAALGGLVFLVMAIVQINLIGFFVGLILIVLGPLSVRIYCEILYVIFGIFDELKSINAKTK